MDFVSSNFGRAGKKCTCHDFIAIELVKDFKEKELIHHMALLMNFVVRFYAGI